MFNVLFCFVLFFFFLRMVMILGKITTLFSSMMGRPDLQPQHMEIRTRRLVLNLAGRTNQASSSLAKPRPE